MSSALLIDETVIVVQPALVRRLGHLCDACVLQQIHYWLGRSRNDRDGHRWVFKTYDDWSDEIGVTVKQVRAAIVRLETAGVIVSCQPEAYHRRKWYRIDYEHPILLDVSSDQMVPSNVSHGQMDRPVRADGSDQTVPCNTETTTEITTETTSENSTSVEIATLDDDDCRRLANLLADLIANNGSKRPTVTDRWVQTIDRMIRLDGRTPEQIENAMRWCQADEFWQANVMSPDKLRKQYDRLRLQASRARTTRGLTGVRDYLATLDH
jgi:hypothetical protein